ncbi:MAG: hypothetical protein SNJ71_00610 [Bacteroidales bacterium]
MRRNFIIKTLRERGVVENDNLQNFVTAFLLKEKITMSNFSEEDIWLAWNKWIDSFPSAVYKSVDIEFTNGEKSNV